MKKIDIIIVTSIIILMLIMLFMLCIFFFFYYDKEPCADIVDSSQKTGCYIELAKTTGNVEYCNVNYYTLKCLKDADPGHSANIEVVKGLCEQVTDTSTRNDCLMYVENNY